MKNSIRSELNKNIILFTLVIALLLGYFTYTTMLSLTFKIAESIAHESSSVISAEVNAIISREIYVASHLLDSGTLIDWMEDEGSKEKEAAAVTSMRSHIKDLRDRNIFIALNDSQNFYFLEEAVPDKLEPQYVLDDTLESDSWYFNTRDYIEDYDLNVDVDRHLDIIRIWVNINVKNEGEFVGIIGTGIELAPILEGIFSEEENYNSESLIFDAYGAIQLIRELDKIQENSFGETEEEKTIFSYSDSEEFKKEVQEFIEHPVRNKVIEVDNKSRFMILSPIENTDWFMATYYDTEEIFALNDFGSLIAMTFGLFMVFIVGINLIVKLKVIRPIENLNESLLNENIYSFERDDEIGNLSNTIVGMNEQLLKYSNEIENKYKLQSELLNNFLDEAPVGVVMMDSETRILSSNQFFRAITKNDGAIRLKDLLNTEVDIVKALRNKNKLVIECTVDGNITWMELQNFSNNSDLHMFDLLVSDVTEKKVYEKELVRMASIDALTGIYNRGQFEKIVAKELYKFRRYERDLSIILFDIDHFKLVNDHYGHSVGDQILQGISELVKEKIRESDYFSRWGGEEFMILMPNTTIDNAWLKAEELRVLIAGHDFPTSERVTVSIGVADFTKDEAYDDVFKKVDRHLYHAKESGRNNVKRD